MEKIKNIFWLILWVAELGVFCWLFTWLYLIDDPIVRLFWWVYIILGSPILILMTREAVREVANNLKK